MQYSTNRGVVITAFNLYRDNCDSGGSVQPRADRAAVSQPSLRYVFDGLSDGNDQRRTNTPETFTLPGVRSRRIGASRWMTRCRQTQRQLCGVAANTSGPGGGPSASHEPAAAPHGHSTVTRQHRSSQRRRAVLTTGVRAAGGCERGGVRDRGGVAAVLRVHQRTRVGHRRGVRVRRRQQHRCRRGALRVPTLTPPCACDHHGRHPVEIRSLYGWTC